MGVREQLWSTATMQAPGSPLAGPRWAPSRCRVGHWGSVFNRGPVTLGSGGCRARGRRIGAGDGAPGPGEGPPPPVLPGLFPSSSWLAWPEGWECRGGLCQVLTPNRRHPLTLVEPHLVVGFSSTTMRARGFLQPPTLKDVPSVGPTSCQPCAGSPGTSDGAGARLYSRGHPPVLLPSPGLKISSVMYPSFVPAPVRNLRAKFTLAQRLARRWAVSVGCAVKNTCEVSSPAWGMRMNEPLGNREGPRAGCLHVKGESSWMVS